MANTSREQSSHINPDDITSVQNCARTLFPELTDNGVVGANQIICLDYQLRGPDYTVVNTEGNGPIFVKNGVAVCDHANCRFNNRGVELRKPTNSR